MTSDTRFGRSHPAACLPTLYPAEGLLFCAVYFVALFFYQEPHAGHVAHERALGRGDLTRSWEGHDFGRAN